MGGLSHSNSITRAAGARTAGARTAGARTAGGASKSEQKPIPMGELGYLMKEWHEIMLRKYVVKDTQQALRAGA